MKISIIKALRIIVIFMLVGIGDITYSQNPPPPPTGDETQQNKLTPEGAPIGGGLFILLAMAGIYGGFKGYKIWKEKKEEDIG